MTLLKLRCISKKARDELVALDPIRWGGYEHSPKGYKWFVYIPQY